MSKHTPAPWVLKGNCLIIHRAGTPAAIQIAILHEARPSDAYLMAMAPELLEALDKICTAHAAWHSCMISGGDADAYSKCKLEIDDSIYEAQALIAKAENN